MLPNGCRAVLLSLLTIAAPLGLVGAQSSDLPDLPPAPGVDLAPVEAALAQARVAVDQALATADEAAAAKLAEAKAALAAAEAQLRATVEGAPPLVEGKLAEVQQAVEEAKAAVDQAVEDANNTVHAKLAEAQVELQKAEAAVRAAMGQVGDAACEQLRDPLLDAPVKVWTSCNMGPDSGLDADTLDGYTSARFWDGIDAEAWARLKGDEELSHRIGALDLEVDQRAWAAVLARDGAGSGLDADRVDGLDSARFVQFAPNGNVGIGTTTPATRLHVAGGELTVNSPRGGVLRTMGESDLEFDGGPDSFFWFRNIGAPGGGTAIGSGIHHFTVLNNGNVGIGVEDPRDLLAVAGRIRSGGLAGLPDSKLVINGYDAGTGAGRGIDFEAVQEGFVFQTYHGGWKSRMYIADNGNVGIGDDDPATPRTPEDRLTVAGNVRVSGAGNGLVFPDGTTQTTAATGGSGGLGGSGTAGRIARFGDASTLADSALFESGGHVGIGTSDPAAELDVAGVARADALQVDPTALGTCGAAERGTMRFVAGGSGQADQLYLCRKDASDAYAWAALV